MTVYNFDTIDVDGKPEVQFKCLKILVGERGFEPPTPWSRTRCSTRLSHSPTGAAGGNREGHPPAQSLLDKQNDYNIAALTETELTKTTKFLALTPHPSVDVISA